MNTLLDQYRSEDGMVDYESLKQNPSDVEEIIAIIQSIDPESMEANDRKAFIINSYNFLVIHEIVQGGIEKTVKENTAFFKQNRISMNGDSASLDELEHLELRAQYNDPRIHFALNCGATSCPPLSKEILNGADLEEQLDDLTREALNDTTHVMIINEERIVRLSPIFDWYKEDFVQDGGVVRFINRFRTDSIPAGFTIVFREYDWSLNSN